MLVIDFSKRRKWEKMSLMGRVCFLLFFLFKDKVDLNNDIFFSY